MRRVRQDTSLGMHDDETGFAFRGLAVAEPGKVDIAPRITHVAAGVDGRLQCPDQSDRARRNLIGIQIRPAGTAAAGNAVDPLLVGGQGDPVQGIHAHPGGVLLLWQEVTEMREDLRLDIQPVELAVDRREIDRRAVAGPRFLDRYRSCPSWSRRLPGSTDYPAARGCRERSVAPGRACGRKV